jgi:hypothetical protein
MPIHRPITVKMIGIITLAPETEWADLDGNLLISNDVYKGMLIVDGKITLNDLPGIGISKL